jgi:hypothetical protein
MISYISEDMDLKQLVKFYIEFAQVTLLRRGIQESQLCVIFRKYKSPSYLDRVSGRPFQLVALEQGSERIEGSKL